MTSPRFVIFDEFSSEFHRRLPEHNLLASVLASGVSEASGNGQWMGSNTPKERRRRQNEAKRWLSSTEIYFSPEKGISFQYICEALCLNANVVRIAIVENPEAIASLMSIFRDRSRKAGNYLPQ